jgi:hypothetical protein
MQRREGAAALSRFFLFQEERLTLTFRGFTCGAEAEAAAVATFVARTTK